VEERGRGPIEEFSGYLAGGAEYGHEKLRLIDMPAETLEYKVKSVTA
jgi:hypothetical protein